MNIEELREYCLSVKGAAESFPFGETTLVFKVMGKMFVYVNIEPKDGVFRVNMKSDPERSADLRERYDGVNRCSHSTGLMWHAVSLYSDVADDMLRELVDHSVEEVIKKLPKKKQEEYAKLKDTE